MGDRLGTPGAADKKKSLTITFVNDEFTKRTRLRTHDSGVTRPGLDLDRSGIEKRVSGSRTQIENLLSSTLCATLIPLVP